MAVLDSNNVKNRPDFAANSAALKKLVDELKANLAVVAQGGGKVANERHTARGKLLPRERVAGLLDPGSPFLEPGTPGGMGHVWWCCARCRRHCRHRPC